MFADALVERSEALETQAEGCAWAFVPRRYPTVRRSPRAGPILEQTAVAAFVFSTVCRFETLPNDRVRKRVGTSLPGMGPVFGKGPKAMHQSMRGQLGQALGNGPPRCVRLKLLNG